MDLPGLPIDSPPDGVDAGSLAGAIDVPARALVVAAHPDDAEFGAGGTLAKWAAAGCVVSHLVCTDGSKGTWDPNQNAIELIATRQAEQRAAAQTLGATSEVVFLGWTDGELESSLRHRWHVAYWIRTLRPTVVLGHDPWRRYRLHPDHRHAGLLAVEGVVAARDPLFFPDQDLEPHRPDALLLWEADEPDYVEDITAHIDTKLAALRAHESQFRTTMGVIPGHPDEDAQWDAFADRLRARAAEWGRLGGYALGEGFKLIDGL